jgi:lysophospholipase L1-like esterase
LWNTGNRKIHAKSLLLTNIKKIVFIGDSLTEYFDWQRRFPEFSVDNLGIAGETVEGLWKRMDQIGSMVKNPDFIFIMTGINDIAMGDYDLTGTYTKILEKLSSLFKDTIMVVQSILPATLPWIDVKIIKMTNDSLKELAWEIHAEFLDLYSAFVDKDSRPLAEYLSYDGVHLSDKGYEKWSEAVARFLRT